MVEGRDGLPFDAIAIAVIVLLNAVLGSAQRARAEHAVEALARMSATTATVVRDGARRRVPTSELVVGDVLVLAEGDTVAADARLLAADSLSVAESSLTGESEPVLKDATTLAAAAALGDRFDMVFDGTAVVRGSGRAVVTHTGMATQMGVIAGLLHATEQDPTPLEREIAHVGRVLGRAVLAIAAAVILTLVLVHGVDSVQDLVTILLLGVSLAVAAVPEGLPTILSVVLALGVQRMAGRNAVVKKLSSVETLGSASVICSDKTGTLTQGEMTVGRVVVASGEVTVTGVGYQPDGRVEVDGAPLEPGSALWTETALVLGGGSLANDAQLVETDGTWTIHGDPTEAAFMVAEVKLGTRELRTGRFSRVGVLPFTSERRMMTSLEVDAERQGRAGGRHQGRAGGRAGPVLARAGRGRRRPVGRGSARARPAPTSSGSRPRPSARSASPTGPWTSRRSSRSTSTSSRSSSTPGRSGSSTPPGRRRPRRSPRRTGRGSGC